VLGLADGSTLLEGAGLLVGVIDCVGLKFSGSNGNTINSPFLGPFFGGAGGSLSPSEARATVGVRGSLQFVQQDLAHNEAGPILPLDARHSRLQSSTE